jgi:hypothetical protein
MAKKKRMVVFCPNVDNAFSDDNYFDLLPNEGDRCENKRFEICFGKIEIKTLIDAY